MDGERKRQAKRTRRHPVPKLLASPLVIPTCNGQVIIDAERKNGHLLIRVQETDSQSKGTVDE